MGLPNITGMFAADTYYTIAEGSGAFLPSTTTPTWAVAAGHAGSIGKYFSFDASLSNSIYGSSETVSPLSQSTLMLVKY